MQKYNQWQKLNHKIYYIMYICINYKKKTLSTSKLVLAVFNATKKSLQHSVTGDVQYLYLGVSFLVL